jgi:excisionase family DNA binding protein
MEVSSKVLEFQNLMTEKEAAEYLRLQPGTLRNMRSRGEGPKFVQMSRFIRYRREALDKYIDECTKDCA